MRVIEAELNGCQGVRGEGNHELLLQECKFPPLEICCVTWYP